jgi:hypothetical protein
MMPPGTRKGQVYSPRWMRATFVTGCCMQLEITKFFENMRFLLLGTGNYTQLLHN